ncbi:MAG: hypothetical protein GY946_24755, partial [bacterium]|nr:hypothetical protein [bacterium]
VATEICTADFALPEGVTWAGQLWAQVQSIVFVALFAPVLTIVILYGLKAALGDLRVDEDAEYEGLDLAEHSETAYAGD